MTAYLGTAGMLASLLRASHSSSAEGEVALAFRAAADLALLGVISGRSTSRSSRT